MPNKSPIDIDKMLTGLDDATELLDACHVLRSIVDGNLDRPVTASELAAALNTVIVCQVVTQQIKSMHNPAYYEEAYNGE